MVLIRRSHLRALAGCKYRKNVVIFAYEIRRLLPEEIPLGPVQAVVTQALRLTCLSHNRQHDVSIVRCIAPFQFVGVRIRFF